VGVTQPAEPRRGLEAALAALESETQGLIKAISELGGRAKRLRAAASEGRMRDIPVALEQAVDRADALAQVARSVRDSWTFEAEAWFASGDYSLELLGHATATGVKAFESDERILCYPAVLQVNAGDTSVTIDRKKERRVRPSFLARRLRTLQERGPRFRPDAFLESLARAYDLVVASSGVRPGSVVKLVDVHRVLTIMPGASRDYDPQEFARDIYLLDQSGLVTSKSGRTLSLPASALTRSGVLRTVTRDGQRKDYAGISFEGSRR
jgi:hypothetical protein